MTERDFSHLAALHSLGDDPIPDVVVKLAAGQPADLVWRNELGGLTFRIADRFVKWNPRRTGIDLHRERVRLEWLSARHRSPRVVASGDDDDAQWLVTEALPGDCAVGDVWRARRSEAIQAIAIGLRAMHAVSVDDFPHGWTAEVWVGRTPKSLGRRPPVLDPVLVHGDACAPNTLISVAGEWTGHVDLGDLAVGDRWADLAVAVPQPRLELRRGTSRRAVPRVRHRARRGTHRYYRALWKLES